MEDCKQFFNKHEFFTIINFLILYFPRQIVIYNNNNNNNNNNNDNDKNLCLVPIVVSNIIQNNISKLLYHILLRINYDRHRRFHFCREVISTHFFLLQGVDFRWLRAMLSWWPVPWYNNIAITTKIYVIIKKPWALLILQPFRHCTYVKTHSLTLPSLCLRHSSFSNPSDASPTL